MVACMGCVCTVWKRSTQSSTPPRPSWDLHKGAWNCRSLLLQGHLSTLLKKHSTKMALLVCVKSLLKIVHDHKCFLFFFNHQPLLPHSRHKDPWTQSQWRLLFQCTVVFLDSLLLSCKISRRCYLHLSDQCKRNVSLSADMSKIE